MTRHLLFYAYFGLAYLYLNLSTNYNYNFIDKRDPEWVYLEWNSSIHNLQLQEPSGGAERGGDKQYMWYPRSQSSQNKSWSYKNENKLFRVIFGNIRRNILLV